MKAAVTPLLLASALLGCNNPSADQPQGPSSNDSKPSATETFTFSLDDLTVSVEHRSMEVSNECPQVLLLNKEGALIDQQTLCEINIEGYQSFNAREGFAFIDFDNYRIDNASLRYNIDLALLQGSSFIAQCSLPIVGEMLSSPECNRRAP